MHGPPPKIWDRLTRDENFPRKLGTPPIIRGRLQQEALAKKSEDGVKDFAQEVT